MTPAQAYGHPDFVTDVPVQGPTDQGMRAASCLFAQTKVPAQSTCVDCRKGSSKMHHSLGEQFVFRNGAGALGFALEAAGDPEIWTKLSPDQQMWISTTLNALNDQIMKQSGTSCPTWGPAINLAGGCFQVWYNAYYAAPKGPSKALRTDGVFDEDTLCALIMIAGLHKVSSTSFPDPGNQHCQAAGAQPATKKKLSTASMVGIGAAGLAGVGLIYTAMHGGHKARRRR